MIKLSKFGYRTVLCFIPILILSFYFDFFCWFFAFIFFLILFIFRDFKNSDRISEFAILTPVCGKVKSIGVDNFQGQKCIKIVIRKGIFDIGVIRSMFAFDFCDMRYRHGLFIPNGLEISQALNEKALLVTKKNNLTFAIRLIAGIFARGISIDKLKYGKTGDNMGFLLNGVATIFLPINAKICVCVSEKLKSNTLLGYFDKKSL